MEDAYLVGDVCELPEFFEKVPSENSYYDSNHEQDDGAANSLLAGKTITAAIRVLGLVVRIQI